MDWIGIVSGLVTMIVIFVIWHFWALPPKKTNLVEILFRNRMAELKEYVKFPEKVTWTDEEGKTAEQLIDPECIHDRYVKRWLRQSFWIRKYIIVDNSMKPAGFHEGTKPEVVDIRKWPEHTIILNAMAVNRADTAFRQVIKPIQKIPIGYIIMAFLAGAFAIGMVFTFVGPYIFH